MPLVVNGQTIDDAVIEQEFSAIKAHYESLGSISCCERDDEFRRLQLRYGCGDNPALWEETKPVVEVTDVDGNNLVTTVIDDPSGTSVSQADVTVDEHQDMLGMIRQQAKDLDRLKKQYESQVRSDQPDADADEDTPEPVASKRAKRQ